MQRKKMAVIGVSAAMLAGAGAGLAVTWPSGAGAGSSLSASVDPTQDTTGGTSATPSTDSTTPSTESAQPNVKPHNGLKDILDQMVAAGTITQDQADAILAAIQAAHPGEPGDHKGGHHGGPGFGGIGGVGGLGGLGGLAGPLQDGLDAAAKAIGITSDQLKTELESGKTIADVATEKGVDVQTVIDAIVASETANIQDQLTKIVTSIVNGDIGKGMWPGHGPEQAPPSTEAPTTTTG